MSPPRNNIAIKKHNGNATRSMQTIRAILVVRCSDTIPAQNWLNTLFDKVGMMRVTRSDDCNGIGKGGALEMAVRNEIKSMRKEIKDFFGNDR